MHEARLVVDYGMTQHGLAPLVVEGRATELDYWGFNKDLVRRLRRLSELYDRQINWASPHDRAHRLSERDRQEFNALLHFVHAELQMELADRWKVVLDTRPL